MHTSRRGRSRPSLVPALAFTLAFACSFVPALAHAARGVVGPPVLGIEWFTIPETPCDGQDVRLMFTACECQVDLQYAGLDSTNGLIHLWLNVQPNIVCFTCVPDTFGVDLGQHAAGWYERTVRFEIEYATTPDPSWPPSPAYGAVTYDVARRCGSPTGVAYLDQVIIGHPRRCVDPCPPLVCPGDSIDVFLAGSFPDDCIWLHGISLVDPPYGSPLPAPPIVQVLYEKASCLGRPCREGPIPWSARVRLPELPPLGGFQYQLAVEGYVRDICFGPDSTWLSAGAASFPFTVAESCSTQVPPPGDPCFNVAWRGPGFSQCLATYSGMQAATVTFAVGSRVPIAGVQGVLTLEAPDVFIQMIESARPGWTLAWNRSSNTQVRFIAFAGPGVEPIPADSAGRPQPLLVAHVASAPGPNVTPRVALVANDLVVSDAAGQGIRACPVITLEYPPPNIALLCHAEPCDANRDGHSDVRDLVLMVNCLQPALPHVRVACPVDSSNVLDCDGNGGFDLDDVFCCARVMLGFPIAYPSAQDSLRRDAPEISVRFGLPRELAGRVLEVPVQFDGMAGVAAARIDVTYPDARYEVVDVAFEGAPTSWWTLHEVRSGRVGLAILDLGALADGSQPMGPVGTGPSRALLHLRLRPGARSGGELALATHDFAAPDGVTLVTPNAQARLELSSIGHVALSAPRPNPFGATFTCALTLPTEGDVDVAVFNSVGRRVATLMRESRVPAGVYTLGWNGVEAGGDRAAAGVYFVRVVTGGAESSRKVLFLPGGAR